MEMYFLKSAACLAILMVFYKFLLEKENMHVFKRWYLLAAVLISFVIPWITFTSYVEPVPGASALIFQPEIAGATSTLEKSSFLSYLLWSLYGIGFLFFGIKFILNLKVILQRIKRNPKIQSGQTTNVLLQEKLAPHTFWSYIFLNKRKYELNAIPEEVFQHEQAHADQRHSADILLMELLQIIFWFHPVLYMAKKAIRLNHEFLADRAVLKNGIQTSTYQKTLLAFSSNALDSSLVNPINYQSIKKRFTVMKTNTSRKMIWTKSVVLLPLLAVLVYSFSTKETRFKTDSSQEIREKLNYTILPSGDTIVISEDINITMVSEEHLLLNGNNISYEELPGMLEQLNSHIPPEDRNKMISADILTTKEFPVGWVNDVKRALYHYGITRPKVTLIGTPENGGEEVREKATPRMIQEYNHLVRKANEEEMLRKDEANRILYIESLMSAEQKNNVIQRELEILQFPPAQEKATPEMVAEYNKWAKHYKENEDALVEKKVWKRMKYIHSIMTPEQRKGSEEFPSLNPKQIITVVEDDDNGKNGAVSNRNGNVPPPPPPPPAPTISKDGSVPPPPPPPPAPTVTKKGDVPLPPPPPPVAGESELPVPPPPPPSPIEAMKKWMEEGAEFYLNGKKVSGEMAFEAVKENNGKNMSVEVEENASGKTVRLSDNKR